jgi:hypothetical protein
LHYPEALKRNGSRRANWFENYLKTTLDRDQWLRAGPQHCDGLYPAVLTLAHNVPQKRWVT